MYNYVYTYGCVCTYTDTQIHITNKLRFLKTGLEMKNNHKNVELYNKNNVCKTASTNWVTCLSHCREPHGQSNKNLVFSRLLTGGLSNII